MSNLTPQQPPNPGFYPAPQQPYPYSKPGKIQAIGIMTMINGILNIMAGITATVGVVLGTLGIGLLCAPLTLIPSILGVVEVVYSLKVINNPPQNVKPWTTLAVIEICCIVWGNVISAVVGVINLVFFNDIEVKAWFDSTQHKPT
jgi:hypothetical protein